MFYGGMLGELVYSFQGTTVTYLHIISEIIWIFYTFQCSNIIYFNGLCWLDQHLLGYAVFEQVQGRHLALCLLAGLYRLQQRGRNDPVRLSALTCGRLPWTWDC